MKTLTTIATITGMTTVMSFNAHAIEGVKDEATPPVVGRASIPSNGKAYLGVVTGRLPEALSAHLGTYTGVIVTGVMPNGPAADAGLNRHDIITRIDNQDLQEPADLSRIVQAKKPGDTLQLETVHEGQKRLLNVTLAERKRERISMSAPPLSQLRMDGVPDTMEQRLRDMIEGNVREFNQPDEFAPAFGLDPQIENMMRDMNRRMKQHLFDFHNEPKGEARDGVAEFQQNATVKVLDDQGSIEINSANGINTLTVRDTDNEVVWSGPWTTKEDKEAAPADIRKRAEKLNIEESLSNSGFQLRLRRGL